MSHQINYAGINRIVKNEEEFNSLLDISINNQIPHMHECGENGN